MKVLVINAPGCPVSWLGTYGNEWIQTPHLDRFASQALVFDQHFITRPDWQAEISQIALEIDPNLLSCQWLWDSRMDFPHPDKHSVTTIQKSEQESRCAALLRSFESAWFKFLSSSQELFWLETDLLLPEWDVDGDLFYRYAERTSLNDEEDLNEILPWDQPPQGPTEELSLLDWDRLHCTYAAVLTEWDNHIGKILHCVQRSETTEPTAIVFTSTIGQALGEHRQIGQSSCNLHEEMVHIPLIVQIPSFPSGKRIAELSQTSDLLAAIRVLLTKQSQTHARLLSLIQNQESPQDYIVIQDGAGKYWSFRSLDWAVLNLGEDQPAQLYSKPEDRWEVNNVAMQHLPWVEYLCSEIPKRIQLPSADPLKSYEEIMESETETEESS